MQTIIIAGNVGKEPELRTTQSGQKVLNFSVAVNDPFRRDAPPTWYGVSVWGKRGEALSWLSKGQSVTVAGQFSTREHNGKTYLEVSADSVTVHGGKSEGGSGYQEPRQEQGHPPSSRDLNDSIPFKPEWRA